VAWSGYRGGDWRSRYCATSSRLMSLVARAGLSARWGTVERRIVGAGRRSLLRVDSRPRDRRVHARRKLRQLPYAARHIGRGCDRRDEAIRPLACSYHSLAPAAPPDCPLSDADRAVSSRSGGKTLPDELHDARIFSPQPRRAQMPEEQVKRHNSAMACDPRSGNGQAKSHIRTNIATPDM
jgi:hypothetical protein